MSESNVTTPESTTGETRDQVVRWAYNEATKNLREKYSEEFRADQIALAATKGVNYAPRKTAEEKARDDLRDLLAAHPDLEQELISKIEDQIAGK